MENAKSQAVTICSLLVDTQSTLKFPIHQRYQYPSENNTYMTITLPKPKLLLGCKERIKELRVSKIDLCSPCVEIVPKWREILYIMVNSKFHYFKYHYIKKLLFCFMNRYILQFFVHFLCRIQKMLYGQYQLVTCICQL